MLVGNYLFVFVSKIIPKLDRDIPLEFLPQSRYNNKKNYSLHKFGKGPFCKFTIDRKHSGKIGVYIIVLDGDICYVGECIDLKDRFNAGYGNISPRNCFVGGQLTNCRINSLILKSFKNNKSVLLYFLETNNRSRVERALIKKLRPVWNRYRPPSKPQADWIGST